MSKKESIIRAATVLFSTKGFENTHMSEISHMTGAAEGTIFYHFKNKEDLFLAILEKFRQDVMNQFDLYLREMEFEDGMEMLEGVLSFYLSLAEKMEDRFLLLHRHDAYELARVNEACKEHLESIYNGLVNIFENALDKGKADGSMVSVPPKKTALIIFSMVDGLVRFNTYELYDAGSLYTELITACRKMVRNQDNSGIGDKNA
ncbi:MAG: TetR/AcrR family transcriptional regulator [Deltaproteobacteria bacterium]|nr:TetR/AcrR family transcriptional regulator [Deltaproteobacteria bacterium]MCF8119627.1 TetR/AcrR family transcriptional regulator [Deltaproteobacteria bacterium]